MNLGQIERILRIIAGVALIMLPLVLGSPSASPLLWALVAIGMVLVITALVSFCPIYRLLGISTFKVK